MRDRGARRESGWLSAALVTTVAVTVGLYVLHIALRGFYPPGHPVRLVATGLLILGVGSVILVQVIVFRSMDEFQRQVHFLALAIAFSLSLFLTFALGFLRAEGVFAGADSRDLPALLLMAYAFGLAFAWRRYSSRYNNLPEANGPRQHPEG